MLIGPVADARLSVSVGGRGSLLDIRTPESVGGCGSVVATSEGSLLFPTMPVLRGLEAELRLGAAEFWIGVIEACDGVD
jgi:hypothetical protein